MKTEMLQKKKYIKVLLLCLLILGSVSILGNRANASAVKEDINLENVIIINPCYEDGIDEKQEKRELFSGENNSQISPYAAANDEYLPLEEAGAILREHMKERSSGFSISVSVDESEFTELEEIWDLLLEEALIHTGVSTEGDYLRWVWKSAGYDLEGTKNGTQYNLTLEINITYMTTAEEEEAATEAVAAIFGELKLNGKTDYDKVYAIYNYICQNVEYDSDNATVTDSNKDTTAFKHAHAAYGAIVNGKAVCQGYASMLYRLLLESGIDARIIVSQNHGWNIIELDGVYYNGDTTWDSGNDSYENFLTGSVVFRKDKSHRATEVYTTTEFLDQYAVSPIDYSDVLNQTVMTGLGSCGTDVTWSLNEEGELRISGTGPMTNLASEVKNHWNDANGWIKKVIIEEGVTSIGDYAFFNCPAIKEIILPKTLTSIGDYAFSFCDSLETITIPFRVEDVAETAFHNCYRLISIIYEENPLPFTDVDIDSWYYDSVKYVYENKIMNGLSDTEFGPEKQLTRAMFATILYRMNGSPKVEYEEIFSDVPDGKWYTDGVMWAYQNSIVKGYGDGTFGTDDNIKREQLAVMMYRYAGYMEYDTSNKEEFSDYPDANQVSEYAIEGMRWAVGNEIITGKKTGDQLYLDPLGQATRAECAAIVMRFTELYKESL